MACLTRLNVAHYEVPTIPRSFAQWIFEETK